MGDAFYPLKVSDCDHARTHAARCEKGRLFCSSAVVRLVPFATLPLASTSGVGWSVLADPPRLHGAWPFWGRVLVSE